MTVPSGCTVTSLETTEYNCIAWAAEENDRVWWPDSLNIGYWPDGVAREETLDAFIAAYATLEYEPCADGVLEPGFQKIVIYSHSGKPTHAARQLPSGLWTSKLGRWFDIEHDTPEKVVRFPQCGGYGQPIQFMKRKQRNP
jgi:hypothetical protein